MQHSNVPNNKNPQPNPAKKITNEDKKIPGKK